MGKPNSLLKRVVDILFSFTVLLFTSPILFIAIVAIKVESKGPAFFIQLRTGKDEKLFSMYKLRSMVVNADRLGPEITQKNDDRITKVGRILRKTSIDELPNFFNVLEGSMTVVGPRPEVPVLTKDYDVQSKKIFEFKPGVTGISQINGRGELTPETRIPMEIEYYRRANFWSDLLILIKTPFIVISNKGNVM